MKKIILLVTALLFLHGKHAFSQSAKPENVRTLLELTGSGKLGVQVMENMIASFKKSMPDVPAEFWDEFMKEVKPETLIDLIVPIYANYYTDKDILDLIEFYKSPLGKKVIRNTPHISQESYAAGSEWGRTLGEQTNRKLKEKGYLKEN